jgi:hypothetical protein
MSAEDKLQQNIRRTTGLQALRQINAIVEEENKDEAAAALALRWLQRYGWVLLLAVVALSGYLMGVY